MVYLFFSVQNSLALVDLVVLLCATAFGPGCSKAKLHLLLEEAWPMVIGGDRSDMVDGWITCRSRNGA